MAKASSRRAFLMRSGGLGSEGEREEIRRNAGRNMSLSRWPTPEGGFAYNDGQACEWLAETAMRGTGGEWILECRPLKKSGSLG